MIGWRWFAALTVKFSALAESEVHFVSEVIFDSEVYYVSEVLPAAK